MTNRIRAGRTPDGLVVSLLPLDPAGPLIVRWRALAREALVENLFFEPDYALAAGIAFGPGVGLLTVADGPPDDPDARLLALWPCRSVRRWGLPLPVLMGWAHDYAVFGAPLIHRSEPDRALRALLEAPRLLGLPPRLMMPYLPLEGRFAEALTRVLASYGGRRADFWRHERGALDLAGRDGPARAAYLGTQLSDRKERQLARLYRRLEAHGPIVHDVVRAPDALAEALDDYIALETRGWKGRLGTAIGWRPAEAAFLRGLVDSYGRADRIRIDRLRRNGRSLAASIAVETGSIFWYLKISHDEAEARNSPGAQLIRLLTLSLLAEGQVDEADSCAPPNFPLIETFWADRRRLAHGLIEASGGDRLFSLATSLERLRVLAGRSKARLAPNRRPPAVSAREAAEA